MIKITYQRDRERGRWKERWRKKIKGFTNFFTTQSIGFPRNQSFMGNEEKKVGKICYRNTSELSALRSSSWKL